MWEKVAQNAFLVCACLLGGRPTTTTIDVLVPAAYIKARLLLQKSVLCLLNDCCVN